MAALPSVHRSVSSWRSADGKRYQVLLTTIEERWRMVTIIDGHDRPYDRRHPLKISLLVTL